MNSPNATTIQFTLTVQIDGEHAADIADDLGIDAEAGDFDLAALAMFRTRLHAMRDTRDYRLVRATVTPVEVTPTTANTVADVAVWQHVTAGERYIVELDDAGRVLAAVGPVYHAHIADMLETGDWTPTAELADELNDHADDYRQLAAAEVTP